MNDQRLAQLLEALAAGHPLSEAAEGCGWKDLDEAGRELMALAAHLKGRGRRRSFATGAGKMELPPPCGEVSPFGSSAKAVVNTDGASRGNPGPAAYGCVYATVDGVVLCGEAQAIGVATNNVAEYRGAIAALGRLKRWGIRRVVLRLDSQLVVRQLEGSYRVKDAGLKPLHAEAASLLDGFDEAVLEYVPRAENALADRLANHALDEQRKNR